MYPPPMPDWRAMLRAAARDAWRDPPQPRPVPRTPRAEAQGRAARPALRVIRGGLAVQARPRPSPPPDAA